MNRIWCGCQSLQHRHLLYLLKDTGMALIFFRVLNSFCWGNKEPWSVVMESSYLKTGIERLSCENIKFSFQANTWYLLKLCASCLCISFLWRWILPRMMERMVHCGNGSWLGHGEDNILHKIQLFLKATKVWPWSCWD